jgi:hypothetical protein
VSATLQFGQLRASPQLLQRSEVENPRRFRNRIVCSLFSRRSAMAARNLSDKIATAFSFRLSCRRSTIRMSGICFSSIRWVSVASRYLPRVAL